MKNLIAALTFIIVTTSFGQEPYTKNESYTYDELHDTYGELVKKYPGKCKLIQFGKSDYGKNIELFIISKEGLFQSPQFKDKAVIMINNAIHPGEPCGVDASVKLSKNLLANDDNLPKDVIIGIIPMYNVGGGHNRSCCSRANQNGPNEYGFRGNAKNLDLNRDFIKCDSRNTRVFYSIYHFLKPNIFIDTHTSNGADYQHIMTLITSQLNKMSPQLADYTRQNINPYLFKEMEKQGYPMVPYVHQVKKTPDDGIMDYLETPRYSTGYTNLFNTISFVSETHMLKTFEQRVESTYSLLKLLVDYTGEHKEELVNLKMKADKMTAEEDKFHLNWKLDTSKFELIKFNGYEAEYKKSDVTGLERLFYNQDKPWTKEIKYFNTYTPIQEINVPDYYIIPQAWLSVIIRLQMNNVELLRLKKDMILDVEVYFIDDYDTGNRPYEGHYLHRDISVSAENKQITYRKGDYLIPVSNPNARFIVETLEPHAPDSYFAWNFFDAILQQKEWFSAYVFEEKAAAVLEENPDLKKQFDEKIKTDEEFAKSSFAQLYFIYKNSDNYERTVNQYPIGRFNGTLEKSTYEVAAKLIGT
jgi:hypothetical protein